jgi:hypothetical protein
MEESAIATGDRLTFEVITETGQATAVDLLVHSDSVEVWHHYRIAAAFDRNLLRRWLTHPDLPLTRADVTFDLDRTVDVHDRTAITDVQGRVVVTLADVRAWPLTASELESLQHLV